MKPLSKKRNPKGHTSMSRPHKNRRNKLRGDKKAARKKVRDEISKYYPERDSTPKDFKTPFGGKGYFLP